MMRGFLFLILLILAMPIYKIVTGVIDEPETLSIKLNGEALIVSTSNELNIIKLSELQSIQVFEGAKNVRFYMKNKDVIVFYSVNYNLEEINEIFKNSNILTIENP